MDYTQNWNAQGLGFGSLIGLGGSPTIESPYHTYAPVTTDSRAYQTTSNTTDARILNFSPVYTINSAGATTTKKEALTSSAQSSQTPSFTPSTSVIPDVSGGTTAQQGQGGGVDWNIIILGAIVLGVGVVAIKFL